MNNEQKCTLGITIPFPLFLTIKIKIVAHDTHGEICCNSLKHNTTIMRVPSFNLCEAGEETKSTRNLRWYLGIASAKVVISH